MGKVADLVREAAARVGVKQHMKGAPDDVNRYYEDCIKQGTYGSGAKGKEACARVAWVRYCTYKNPDYEGCSKFSRQFGGPYSGPLAK